MAQYFSIHAESPQLRLIQQTTHILQNGGVIAYPTDSGYALGCMMGDKVAQDKIRQIRGVGEDRLFTLVCKNLSELATYAQVNNSQFRLLKANTPGAYTFILKASREVPRRLQSPKRSTVGLRVPEHQVVMALLEQLNEPLLSMTLHLKGDEWPMSEAWEIRDRLEHQLDLVIDSGHCVPDPTTVIDLTEDVPTLIRLGSGNPTPFGLER